MLIAFRAKLYTVCYVLLDLSTRRLIRRSLDATFLNMKTTNKFVLVAGTDGFFRNRKNLCKLDAF